MVLAWLQMFGAINYTRELVLLVLTLADWVLGCPRGCDAGHCLGAALLGPPQLNWCCGPGQGPPGICPGSLPQWPGQHCPDAWGGGAGKTPQGPKNRKEGENEENTKMLSMAGTMKRLK